MVYIVTVVHNRFSITQRFVECLKKQTFQNYKLILVDDGSTDGTAEMVRRNLPNTTVLYGNGNLWWGGGLHKAYRFLMGDQAAQPDDFVWIVNDDTQFETDFLETGIEILMSNQTSFVTASGYSLNSGKQIDGPVSYDFKTGYTTVLSPDAKGNCASTRSLFLTMNALRTVGGFHPVLLPHYGSDYEFTIRAHKKGYSIISSDKLRYTFDEGTTGEKNTEHLTVKKVFSKRSVFNPVYRFSFIFLATPKKYLFTHLKNQIARYFKKTS